MKRCWAVGCYTQIQSRFLMCLTHWAMVPKPIQAEVYSTVKCLETGLGFQKYTIAIERARLAVAEEERFSTEILQSIRSDLQKLQAMKDDA